jgi:CelD/BcsL family acetyltransferase involved in cellulose biosynthesis
MALDVEWVDDVRRWHDYRAAWDDVVACGARSTIFSTWDFLESSWLGFAQPGGNRLAIFVFREEGKVIGFMPLRLSVRRRLGLPLRRLAPLAAWNADYHEPLVAPARRERECADALLSCLERHRDEWDSISLEGTDEEHCSLQAVRAWAARRPAIRLLEKRLSPSPYIDLDRGDALERLGPGARKSVRRCRRQLEAEGPVSIEVCQEPGQMDAALDAYLDLEHRSWKRESAQGVGKDETNRAFFRQLLPRLAAGGRALLMFLKLGERRIAGNIDLLLGTTAYSSQTAFDQAYARFSPGNVLLSLGLPWHAERGIRRYELFALFLGHKQRFTDDARPNVNLRAFQLRGLRRRLLFLPGIVKRAVKSS